MGPEARNTLIAKSLFCELPFSPTAQSRELPVSRITLRKLLLEGLEGVIHFEKRFRRYEKKVPNGPVTAYFEGGSAVQGDVLIGADGASSTIRSQLLPHARRNDTGIVAISGKAPRNDSVRRNTPHEFFAGPTLVLGPGGRFMFGSAVEFPSNGRSSSDMRDGLQDGWVAMRHRFSA